MQNKEYFINKVINIDCVKLMCEMPNCLINLTVSSPPYSDLRSYKGTLNFTHSVFQNIAKELFRVTKEGGYVVWIVGDKTEKGSETGTSFEQALYFKEIGFKLHDTMIYEKHNFANPSKNRYHQIFEYCFVFVKGDAKIFNPIKDVPTVMYGQTNWGKNTIRRGDNLVELPKKEYKTPFGMRRNIWKYSTGGTTDKDNKLACQHPAKFPIKLAEDHIASWSNKGDLIFDPMCGGGTTLVAAKRLGRNFIGCDIVKEYTEIAEKRLKLVKI